MQDAKALLSRFERENIHTGAYAKKVHFKSTPIIRKPLKYWIKSLCRPTKPKANWIVTALQQLMPWSKTAHWQQGNTFELKPLLEDVTFRRNCSIKFWLDGHIMDDFMLPFRSHGELNHVIQLNQSLTRRNASGNCHVREDAICPHAFWHQHNLCHLIIQSNISKFFGIASAYSLPKYYNYAQHG